jgi:ribosomal protein S24E
MQAFYIHFVLSKRSAMATITLRSVDDKLLARLKQEAAKQGTSMNQLVLEALRVQFGLSKDKHFTKTYHDLDGLFGAWSEEEYRSIRDKIDQERSIDEELWS